MKWLEVQWGGKLTRIPVEKRHGKTWFHIDGQTHCFEPKVQALRTDSTSAQPGSGVVLSPMPGKVLKVKVSQGEKVKKGDVLVVIEAMKMEYSLETDVDGTITDLYCKEGEQVSLNKKLIVVQGESL